MSRPLRIEYPNAWYHVMNRGAGRREVFSQLNFFQLFLDLLMDANVKYQLEVHAYCLMNNHYHLLVRTPSSNLGEIMQSINGVFTRKCNYLIGSDGPIFRGRYKAILVDAESYLLELSRYIHLNPVLAGIVNKPEEYRWSSYRYYLSHSKKPNWLFCDETLDHFGHEKIRNYKKFIISGMNGAKSINEQDLKNPILGSDQFIEKINFKHLQFPNCEKMAEKHWVLARLSPTIEDVVTAVSNYFSITVEELISIKNKKGGYLPKDLTIYLGLQLPNQNLNSISKIFNNITSSNVSQIYNRLKKEVEINAKLMNHVNAIKKRLQQRKKFDEKIKA